MYNNLVKCLPLTFLQTISICFWPTCAQLESTFSPEVTIPQGTLQGAIFTTNHQRNISGFLGIPYGKPPIGNLRFANPKAADGWNGIRNATVDANVCPQKSRSANTVMQGNEDCLYLNVYTPRLPGRTKTSLLPVMLFIYGGGFTAGSARSNIYNAEYLLDEDVVLVVPNYRLGPLGFLSTGDEIASGNWGLKDIVLALKWVQTNVNYFGGDPDQVTIFGQSAGAAMSHILTLSNTTIGLFHRYITQSGSALATWAYQPRAAYAKRAFELGEYVGCCNDTSDSLVDCLREVDVSHMIATYPKFFVWQAHPVVVWTMTDEPNIEGAVLTDSPANLFAAGKTRDLPWMSGVTRDEGSFYAIQIYQDGQTLEHFLENIHHFLPAMLFWTHESEATRAVRVNAIKSYYFNGDRTIDQNLLLSNYTILFGDYVFFYPVYNALRQQLARAQNPQYFYTFNYRGTNSKSYYYSDYETDYGVVHGDDVLYLFPPQGNFQNYNAFVSETDFEIVDTMVQLWTSFAINRTPTTSNCATTWEPFSTKDNYLRIGNGSDVALEVRYSFFKERMQFWDDLMTSAATVGAINFSLNSLLIILPVCFEFVLSSSS